MTTSFDFGKSYTLDEQRVNTGARVTHEPSGMVFFIARATNRLYNAAVRASYKKHEKQLAVVDNDRASAEAIVQAAKLSESLLLAVQAKHILTGWEGEVEINGVRHPYSEAAAMQLLSFEEFHNWVMQEATNTENYRSQPVEEDEKN